MRYAVRFMMKPKKGHFKKRYGTLVMETNRKYKTLIGAKKEAKKMKKYYYQGRFKKYTTKVWIIKKRR